MLSYLWNCSENNGPLWRNQTISLCMEVEKCEYFSLGKHGDIRLILMLLNIFGTLGGFWTLWKRAKV